MHDVKNLIGCLNGSFPYTNYSDEIAKDHNKNIPKINKVLIFLGLIAFSLAFGIAIAMSGEDGKPVLNFLTSFVEIIMKITNWIIHLAPVGVCFLVAGEVIGMKDVAENFGKLGWFFATVVLGLSIHGLLLLPILYSAITRSLPFHFIKNMSRALATAFGTSSSSATLPVTIGK